LTDMARKDEIPSATKRKKPLSKGAQLRKKIRDTEARIRDLRARARRENDPAQKQVLDRQLSKASRKLNASRQELKTLDSLIPGGPQGLRTSGVGIVRVGAPRSVGDSQASHRKHKGFRS
jgi:protein subunit release factor A